VSASTGRLIVFEAPEGAGKTTQLRRLEAWLQGAKVPVTAVREPGGTPLGDDIRAWLLDPKHADLTPRAEAMLFMASRAELVERVIRPALARGEFVLADRFFLSTYAYQVFGRGLAFEPVRTANALATGGLVPDITLVFSLDAAVRNARANARGHADKIERAGAEFHAKVAAAFTKFADAEWQAAHPECGPIVAINGDGSETEVFERVLAALAARWPASFGAPARRS
jgi:dTMP kinase